MKFANYELFKDFIINILDIDDDLIGCHINSPEGVYFEIEKSTSFSFIMRILIDSNKFFRMPSFKAEFDFNIEFETEDYLEVEEKLYTQDDKCRFFIKHFEKFEYEEA